MLLTKVEPRINSGGNLRIPDLVAWEKDKSIVHRCHRSLTIDKDVQIWMTNNSPCEFLPPKVYVTCNRLQPERSDLIKIVLLLVRPRLLQKHVIEFVNGSSFRHLPHVETSQTKNAKVVAEKSWR